MHSPSDKTDSSLQESPAATPVNPTHDPRGIKAKRILVIDDNEDFTTLVATFLKILSAYVTVARNGKTGLELAAAGDFDAVIVDIEMPELDGLEVTRRLRAQGYSLPVLAISAHAMAQHAEQARQAGCTAFHSKPITMAKLAEALAAVLQPPAT